MAILRRLGYVIAGLVTTLLVIVVTAVIVIQTDWFKDWLRRLAVDRAASFLNGELRIQRLGGSLFHGVDLDGLSLTQGGVTLIDAERITVRYDPIRMWREGLAFDTIEVQRPRIRVVQDASGWNIAHIVKPRKTPSSKPASFRISALTVSRADVTVEPLQAESRHLSSVDIAGRLEQKGGAFSMTVDRFSGTDDRTGYTIESLTGGFDGSFSHVNVLFRASAGASRLGGRVTSEPQPQGRRLLGEIDMDRLDLARLLERDSWRSDISGHASVSWNQSPDRQTASTLAFRFVGTQASAFGYEGQNIDVTGTYTENRVAFKGRADGYGATATTDATLVLSTGGRPPVFTSTGTFARANLARMPGSLPIPDFQSAFAGRYRVETNGSAWNADVMLASSTFEGAAIDAGTTGHIDVAGGVIRYEGQGTTSGLNVRRLAGPLDVGLLGQPRFESVLNGTFHVIGTEARGTRHVVAETTLHDSVMAGTRFPALDLTTTIDGRRVDVSALGDFAGLTEVLPDLPSSVPFVLNGHADAALTIHDYDLPVTVESMDVRGRVDLGPSSVRGIDVTKAAIDADLLAGVATVRAFTLDAPALTGSATGVLALGSTGESKLEVGMTSADLAALGDVIGKPLKGGAELKVAVTGPSADMRASGTLNGHALNYGTTASALTMNTTFDATLPEQDVARLTVKAKSEGTFIKAAGLEILRATATTDYAEKQVAVDGHFEEQSRTLDLAGIVALGDTGRDVAVRRLELATAGTTWTLPAEQDAHVRIDNDRVHVERLALTNGEQRLDISGSLATAEGAVSGGEPLTIHARNVQVADVNHLMLGTRNLAGLINADATVRGTANAPDVDATLTITAGSVEAVHFDAVRAKVAYARGSAVVDAVLDQTATTQLRVTGTVPVSATADRKAMDLSVTSNPVDLGLVQAFTTAVTNVAGTATFDMRVTGTLKEPVVDGTLDVADGHFAVDATGVTYNNLDTRLEFVSNRLRIASLQIEDDDHHVARASGALDLVSGSKGPQTFDIALTADDFHVMNNPFGVVQVDALVRAQGDFAAPRLSGTVRIDQGRIEVDRVLEKTTKSVYSTKPQDALDNAPTVVADKVSDAAQAPGSFFSRVDLDLALEMPDNLVLRGRDLRVSSSSMGLGDMNIISGGALSLKKAPGRDLAISGTMQVVRGYYSFQGRRFNVQRDSEVRFRGQSPIDPTLDITADREISGVTATVGVQGSLSDPRIALSSSPPLDDADVLSLIVFGAPVNDLGVGQRNSLSERAASMAAGAIATPVADSVARALNLDLFEIQTQGTSAATVSLGSQIGTRLYVGLKQDVGQGDTTALSLEYQLASFVRLVTSIVQNAAEKNATSQNRQQSGVDLIFVFRY